MIPNNLAGEVGFEPTIFASRVRRLTAWPLAINGAIILNHDEFF